MGKRLEGSGVEFRKADIAIAQKITSGYSDKVSNDIRYGAMIHRCIALTLGVFSLLAMGYFSVLTEHGMKGTLPYLLCFGVFASALGVYLSVKKWHYWSLVGDFESATRACKNGIMDIFRPLSDAPDLFASKEGDAIERRVNDVKETYLSLIGVFANLVFWGSDFVKTARGKVVLTALILVSLVAVASYLCIEDFNTLVTEEVMRAHKNLDVISLTLFLILAQVLLLIPNLTPQKDRVDILSTLHINRVGEIIDANIDKGSNDVDSKFATGKPVEDI